MYRKNGRALCGSMRRPQAGFEAQPRAARLLALKMGIIPTNGVRVRRGAFVFAGAVRRADRGVRPYKALCEAAICCAILIVPSARAGQSPAPTQNNHFFTITHSFKKRPVPGRNGAHIIYSTVLARSNSS